MFGIKNPFEKRKAPLRHRPSAFMNLAYQKVPTKVGTWDTDPVGMAVMTDEELLTSIVTAGVCNTILPVYLALDLGQAYEIYQINVYSGDGGYKSAASNTGTLKLKTGLTSVLADATERDTQTTVSAAYVPITTGYDGEGIPVRYVFLELIGDGTRSQYLKPAEIEVLGC